ncbi:MAG: trypsin-like peptidase domain-containing protein [Spirochaetaceae bacterium]|jgi:S1-C subfamily serine protease|nr:trypsin-like peptidase domain-containing protein [Spirochaetaceae bacterium]
MKKKYKYIFFRCLAVFCVLGGFFACTSAEERLSPPKSTSEYRMADIEKYTAEDPTRAIHLIMGYRATYGERSRYAQDFSDETAKRLEELEQQAGINMRDAQALALREERWEDAASLARSLSAMGITVENTGAEPEIILSEARAAMEEGSNLKAFLSAVRSHELKPLSLSDLLPFLERAVEQKQRRTAAFFLQAADEATLKGRLGETPAAIPPNLREYAEGRDMVSDMVKGVATVLVDRGFRTERGMTYPDRILGSAFFVDSSGLLITNYHVIASEVDPSYEGYSRMYIRMGDASSPRIRARAVGWDKAMDLALIKADYKSDYVFPVIDRGIPKAGDTIYAIGSPGGLEKTVTQGIVSALGRRFLQLGDVIQIDAAIHPGNSGGPIIDRDGRLVGIAFAGVEQYQGLNFAIPAERLAAALPAMLKGGKAERPWLGLTIAEAGSSSLRAEIIYVAPYTPAWEQKLQEGLIINSINGEKVTAPQGFLIPALQDRLFPARPGELVSLELTDPETGVTERRIIRTASRPEIPLAEAAEKDSKERMAAPLYGMILAPAVGKGFSVSFFVKRVIRGSIADEVGLSEQDPVSIKAFRIEKESGIAFMDISVKKRRSGFIETFMRLPALLDSPDTL